jgi:hypothetical protein
MTVYVPVFFALLPLGVLAGISPADISASSISSACGGNYICSPLAIAAVSASHPSLVLVVYDVSFYQWQSKKNFISLLDLSAEKDLMTQQLKYRYKTASLIDLPPALQLHSASSFRAALYLRDNDYSIPTMMEVYVNLSAVAPLNATFKIKRSWTDQWGSSSYASGVTKQGEVWFLTASTFGSGAKQTQITKFNLRNWTAPSIGNRGPALAMSNWTAGTFWDLDNTQGSFSPVDNTLSMSTGPAFVSTICTPMRGAPRWQLPMVCTYYVGNSSHSSPLVSNITLSSPPLDYYAAAFLYEGSFGLLINSTGSPGTKKTLTYFNLNLSHSLLAQKPAQSLPSPYADTTTQTPLYSIFAQPAAHSKQLSASGGTCVYTLSGSSTNGTTYTLHQLAAPPAPAVTSAGSEHAFPPPVRLLSAGQMSIKESWAVTSPCAWTGTGIPYVYTASGRYIWRFPATCDT